MGLLTIHLQKEVADQTEAEQLVAAVENFMAAHPEVKVQSAYRVPLPIPGEPPE